MKRARPILAVAWALAACASAPAQGRAGAASTIGPVAPNIYEIPVEQVAAPQEQTPFVEVNGMAVVDVPADQAQVSFAVETRAAVAAEASSANAALMTRVLSALRGASLPGLDLETFGYSLQPQYATDSQRVRSIAGYAAHNNVRATIDDVNMVGRVIDVAIGAGANQVSSIAFVASDVEPARAEALAQAVGNARAQAEVIARALGFELGPPLEIRGGADRPMPIMMEAMRSVQVSDATPIEAGDQSVSANVTVRFALGRALSGR
ncbi:MAG: SIMPL domain-containing protein [Gemmatimonadales bacterium]